MTDEMIEFEEVSKTYEDILAVDNISLKVDEGELLALLGPSGSGKTTTLRMLAGFEHPTSGQIYMNGYSMNNIPVRNRDTAMVFQSYALFPHMTVEENIEFGLKRKNYEPDKITQRVEQVLSMTDMSDFASRRPSNLSGGQQQRVATARALAVEPKVLLMDEPLGALDKKLRDELRVELVNLLDRTNITTIYVTHNQDEALTMADHVAVMNEGQIEQIASPEDLYSQPKTKFVAEFIGETNFIKKDIIQNQISSRQRNSGQEKDLKSDLNGKTYFIRPKNLLLIGQGQETVKDYSYSCEIEQALFLGSQIQYVVSMNGHMLTVEQDYEGGDRLRKGAAATLAFDHSDIQVIEQ